MFPPFVSEQVEVGLKADWDRFATTLSAFQITQPSAFTDPVTNRFGVDGEQRYRGLELELFGTPLRNVRLLGGAALIDAELTKTQGGVNEGNQAFAVPELNFNLRAEWDPPFFSGLTLTGRVIHTSKQFVNAANTQDIPDWTRLDLGARYTFEVHNRPVTIRANVENALDKDYWAHTTFGVLSLGAPRTFLISTSVDF